MLRHAVLALALAGLAQPALALSCAPANISSDFAAASESPENWIVADGTLSFDAAASPVPPGGGSKNPMARSFPAQFSGMALTDEGFTYPLDAEITVHLTCAGPWCGDIAPGNFLAFLKQEARGYALIVGPCPRFVYRDPDPSLKETVTACMAGGGCD